MALKGLAIFLVFSLGFLSNSSAQNSSFLKEGKWLRMGVVEEGIYKINRSDLASMSFDVNTLDPRNIKIFGNGSKVLSQKIGVDTPLGLKENRIHVAGEQDGTMDIGDYILFYAQDPHQVVLDPISKSFKAQKNYYTDTAYYYITLGTNPGLRIEQLLDIESPFPIVDSYNKANFLEQTFYNALTSGREWFGDMLEASTPNRNYTWSTGEIEANSEVIIQADILGYSFLPTSFSISVNGLNLGSASIPAVNDYAYDEMGVIVKNVFSTNSNLIDGEEVIVNVSFQSANASRISEAYIDKLLLHTVHQLRYAGIPLIFSSLESLEQANSEYFIENTSPLLKIWDITESEEPIEQLVRTENSSVRFGAESAELKKYIIFNPSSGLPKPLFYEEISNQDIKGSDVPDLLIVSAPQFLSEAERLAQFRRSENGLDVLVVTTDQIFNEFSYGSRDPTAIRNAAYYFYSNPSAPAKLKNLLLMGRGSYDYKNARNYGLNFVPIYESRESLDPLRTYGSDDYYGFLELGEGDWLEGSLGNETMDIGVGRLPVKSLTEARQVVDKLISYETGEDIFGEWRRKIVFVADDGDFNIHQSQADQLSRFVDTTFLRFDPLKLYLDQYPQEPRAGGEKSPEMSEAINRSIEEGALIMNYTGHGGEAGWTQEFVLDQFIINDWKNSKKLPLFVTATCEFGRHDNPARISSGEFSLLNPLGGSIGLVSTSRPVFSSTNFQLNKAFYNVVFDEPELGGISLGEIFRRTKNNSSNGVFNRNFSLLGDPSMHLAYPGNRIKVTAINESSLELADTLKALSAVTVKGEVRDFSDMLLNDFSGILDFTFYDKQQNIQTLGDENPPFNYKDWNTRLFRGKASVINGMFEIQFILPKNLVYTLGEGKISMYAFDENSRQDASGTELKIAIGGTNEDAIQDNIPPEIQLFMNDESFLNGSTVSRNSKLLVKLFDESGINISGLGVGQRLMAVLDDELVIDLNPYYSASLDDFTHGSAVYELIGMEDGEHSIKVTAWDAYNNYNEASIDFVVSQKNEIKIHRVLSAPNPFTMETAISVEHNRPGEDVEIWLEVYNSMGRKILEENSLIENSPIRIEIKNWDGTLTDGQIIEKGLYVVTVTIRSLVDGSKNRAYNKLLYLK